jgi:hypothetical protein
MVDRELAFMPIDVPCQGRGHDARAIDQQRERLSAPHDLSGESLNGIRIDQIQWMDRNTGVPSQGLARTVRVSGWDDDLSTGSGEASGSDQPQTGIPAGDNGEMSRQINSGHDLSCGTGGGKR